MEVIIDGVVYVPKEKSELEVMKEKYASGGYLLIVKQLVKNNMLVVGDFWEKFECKELDAKDDLALINENKAKLISKKHADILDAYLNDSSVEIEFYLPNNNQIKIDDTKLWFLDLNFINEYNENCEYRLKPKEEYPIFKVNEDGEVFKFNNEYEGIQIFGNNLYNLINPMHHNLKTIPYYILKVFVNSKGITEFHTKNYVYSFVLEKFKNNLDTILFQLSDEEISELEKSLKIVESKGVSYGKRY